MVTGFYPFVFLSALTVGGYSELNCLRLKKGPEQKPGPVFAFVATVAVDVVVAAIGDVVILGDVQPVAESVGRSRIFSSIGIGVVPILEKFKFSKSQTFFCYVPNPRS